MSLHRAPSWNFHLQPNSYDEEPEKPAPAAPAAPAVKNEPEAVVKSEPAAEPSAAPPDSYDAPAVKNEYSPEDNDAHMGGSAFNQGANHAFKEEPAQDDNYGPINVKEDG